MGSGCTNNSLKNNCTNPTTSNCTIWQGGDVELLGICDGDSLTEVENAVIVKLLTVMDGTGITLADLTADCTFMSTQLVGKDKTLDVLMQVLFDSQCTLRDLIQELSDQVNTPVSYDPVCLTPGTYTTATLLQAVVNEVCSLKTDVDNLTSQLQNGNLGDTINTYIGDYISTNINTDDKGGYGISRTGSGATSTITLYGLIPPHCPIWSYANLSNFDSSGAGKLNTPFYGMYICNGLNNTPDLRGFVLAGATSLPGINGNTLISEVNPVIQNDPDINTAILQRKGVYKVQLSTSEIPSHSHSASDTGHTHSTPILGNFNIAGGSTASGYSNQGSTQTGTGYANITIGSTGGNQKHENRQPTVFGFFITRTY